MIKDNNSVSGISWIRYKGLSNEIIMDNMSKVIIKVKNFVKCDIEDLAIFGLEMMMPYHMNAFLCTTLIISCWMVLYYCTSLWFLGVHIFL